MKIILSIFLILALLIGGGVYFLLQPKNLGITYADTDLKSITEKLKVTYESLPPGNPSGKTLIASGAHPVDSTFSSRELTAAADNRYKQYVYFPFRNVQIRVNADGTVEGSAKVGFSDAVNYLVALGVSYDDVMEGAKKFKIPNASLPVYLKVSGTVENNQSNIKVDAAEISRIPIPQNLVNQYGPAINDLVEMVLEERQPSYSIEKLEVVDGKVHFKGTSPDKETAVTKL